MVLHRLVHVWQNDAGFARLCDVEQAVVDFMPLDAVVLEDLVGDRLLLGELVSALVLELHDVPERAFRDAQGRAALL